MAKFGRFDPRNKKNGRHKDASRKGDHFKRIKFVEKGTISKYRKESEDSDSRNNE